MSVGSTISATSQIARDNSGQLLPPNQCILDTVLTLTPTPDEVDWHQPAMHLAGRFAAGQRQHLVDGLGAERTIQPFGVTWKCLIEQEDRTAALGCYRAATMLALKRALRNGSVLVDHSIAYRQREERLIPHDLWERDRAPSCAISVCLETAKLPTACRGGALSGS